MSEEVIEYKKLIDNDSTLSKNNLFNFYNKFNNSCENFNDELFCNDDLYNGVKENVKDILRKLMRNVNKLSMNKGQDYNSIDKGNHNNKRCIYLKYWLYDIILANKFDESNISSLFDEWSKNKGKITGKDIKCEIYKLSLSEIKDIKKLYDYFVFFDGYNFVKHIINEKIYNNRYLDYLKGAIDVYKKTEIECSKNENTREYCKEFDEYIKLYIENKVLYTLEEKILNEDIVTLIGKTYEPQSALLKPLDQAVLEKKGSENPNINTDVLSKGFPLKFFFEWLNFAYSDNSNSFICNSLIKDKRNRSINMYKYCNILNVILHKWEDILKIFKSKINENKCCEYLNYWLHSKLQNNAHRSEDIKFIYVAWDWINRTIPGDNHCEHKNFNVNGKDFKKKLELYIFLEFYDYIKNKLGNVDTDENDKYCDYIKDGFDLYYNMKSEAILQTNRVYNDELFVFEKKFDKTNLCELTKKCPHRCLDLIFGTQNKPLCQAEQEKPNDRMREKLKAPEATKEFSENILQKFSEYQIYDEFSSKDNCYKYCNHCKNIYIFEKEYPGISDFCRMLVRNLYEIKNKNDRKYRCGYLYYWIYENAWRVFGENWNKIHGKEPVVTLFNIGYEIINELKMNECFYDYDTKISLEEWKEKKDLHDYFNNYKNIEKNVQFDETKNQMYCKYFIYIKKLYKKYIKKCCKYYDHYSYLNTCSDYFKCDRIYYPNNFLCRLNCQVDKLTHDSNKAVKNIRIEEQKDSANFNSEISTKSLDNPSTQDSQESIFNELMKDPFYISSLGGFTLLGTFMVFFLFYKFTPLGSRLNKTSPRGKEKIYNVTKEQRKKIIYNNSENQNVNIPKGRVRIAYQSS